MRLRATNTITTITNGVIYLLKFKMLLGAFFGLQATPESADCLLLDKVLLTQLLLLDSCHSAKKPCWQRRRKPVSILQQSADALMCLLLDPCLGQFQW